jgi:hypothetical protein
LGSLWTGSARFFALTPSPSPTAWERGKPHADLFGVLKRSFSIRRKLRFRTPYAPSPTGGRGEGRGANRRSPLLLRADAEEVCQRRDADFGHAQHVLRVQRLVDGLDGFAVVGAGVGVFDARELLGELLAQLA